MPSGRRTRERQLAKLAARRAAERRRKRRQRILTISIALLLAAGGLSYAGVALLKKPSKNASATPTPTPTGSVSPSPSPSGSPAPAVACGGKKPHAASVKKPHYSKAPATTISAGKTYTATMVTSCGTFVIRLDQKSAPKTVNSIVFLAQHHFYDGLTFHRIAQGFVIQGGDPIGDGSGGPGYRTVDTPPENAMYPKGTVAMAKTGTDAPGTSGSQFFVVTSDSAQPALAPGGTGQYAIVGRVVSGLGVVDKIAALPIVGGATDGHPESTVYIVSVTIKVT